MQYIMIILAIVLGKLLWDILDDYRKKMKPERNNKKKQKQSRPKNGEVIDLSNAWINMDDMPYRRRDYLLSGRELALYRLFNHVLQNSSYVAFPRVSLEDIFNVSMEADNRTEYLHRIRNRYVDMLICENTELRPVLIVIGEDPTEPRKKQQVLEDRFIRNAADAAGIKYLPINLNNIPDNEYLINLLQQSALSI